VIEATLRHFEFAGCWSLLGALALIAAAASIMAPPASVLSSGTTTTTTTSSSSRTSDRIDSLDTFRGLAVLLGLVVNWWGRLQAPGGILRHNRTYLSIADVIMPCFFTAVGFSYRLTFLRAMSKPDATWYTAAGAVWRRSRALLILCVFWYGLWSGSWYPSFNTKSLWRNYFQTLVIIPLTQLLCLPVIAQGWSTISLYIVLVTAVYSGISYWFYYSIAMEVPVIDGGSSSSPLDRSNQRND